jgi:hypothetical protein
MYSIIRRALLLYFVFVHDLFAVSDSKDGLNYLISVYKKNASIPSMKTFDFD